MSHKKIRPKSILFVCTGNTCRSVMAKGILSKELTQAGLKDIKVLSAGTLAVDGLSPTEETIEVMKEHGIDVSKEKSSELTKELVSKADLILTMSNLHKMQILENYPETKDKVYLFGEYVSTASDNIHEIPDPIGHSVEFYKKIFDQIKSYIDKLVAIIKI